MIDFIIKYWLEAVFALILAGFGGFFRWIYKHLKDQLKGQELARQGLTAILHDLLYKDCAAYIAAGEISPDDLENLTLMYETYHALGGNGTGTTLYKRCQKLAIKQKEEGT